MANPFSTTHESAAVATVLESTATKSSIWGLAKDFGLDTDQAREALDVPEEEKRGGKRSSGRKGGKRSSGREKKRSNSNGGGGGGGDDDLFLGLGAPKLTIGTPIASKNETGATFATGATVMSKGGVIIGAAGKGTAEREGKGERSESSGLLSSPSSVSSTSLSSSSTSQERRRDEERRQDEERRRQELEDLEEGRRGGLRGSGSGGGGGGGGGDEENYHGNEESELEIEERQRKQREMAARHSTELQLSRARILNEQESNYQSAVDKKLVGAGETTWLLNADPAPVGCWDGIFCCGRDSYPAIVITNMLHRIRENT